MFHFCEPATLVTSIIISLFASAVLVLPHHHTDAFALFHSLVGFSSSCLLVFHLYDVHANKIRLLIVFSARSLIIFPCSFSKLLSQLPLLRPLTIALPEERERERGKKRLFTATRQHSLDRKTRSPHHLSPPARSFPLFVLHTRNSPIRYLSH